MAAIFVLALIPPESQHTYMREVEFFTLESLRLDHIIEGMRAQIAAELPNVIADFLTACNELELSL